MWKDRILATENVFDSVQISFPLTARVIDVNYLKLRVEIERGRPLFTCTEAGILDTAKWNMGFTACSR